jgi:hypothetical protein
VGLVNDLTTNAVVSSFTLTFSERMDATSVRSLALYTLTEAGPDNNFDTADDSPFTVSSLSYVFGSLTATVNLPAALPDGRFRLRIASQPTASMVDLAGNRLDGDNNASAGGDFAVRFRIDRTGPVVQSITPSGSLQVGPSQFLITFLNTGDINASTITNVANYTLLRSPDATFGNPDDVNISAQITSVSFNASSYVATVQLAAPLPTNNRYRLVLGTGLRDLGNNPINGGTPFNHDIIVDATRPTAALAGVFTTGRLNTNLGYVDIQWNDGAGSGVSNVNPLSVSISGVTVTGASPQGGGIFRYTYTGSLAQGVITVSAAAGAATDGAGNTSLASTVGTFTFDSVLPTAQLVSPAAGSTINTEPGFIDIRWLDNAPGTGINAATINASNITVPGVVISGVTPQAGGVFRYAYSGTLPQGPLTITVGSSPVADLAGNQFAGAVGSFTVATAGPRIITSGLNIVAGNPVLDIVFSDNTNIATLISNGTITSNIRIANSFGTFIPLALSRYTYNAATRTLRIDLTGGANPSNAPFVEGITYQLRITRSAVTNTLGTQMVDDDGVLDGVVRRNFVFDRPNTYQGGGLG